MRTAVFPGSFDPVTRGHENVVLRGLNLFDEVIVAVGQHSTKKGAFPVEERLAMLRETFADQPRVKVMSYTGLTSEFCHKVGAHGPAAWGSKRHRLRLRADHGPDDRAKCTPIWTPWCF